MIRLPKETELDSLGTHAEVVSIEPCVENVQDLSRITPPASSESGEVTMSSDSSMEFELGSPQE